MKRVIWILLCAGICGGCGMEASGRKEVKKQEVAERPVDSNEVPGEFTDLETGSDVTLLKDDETGYVLNAHTGEPVEFYINMNTMDTFYGRTGTVVNNAIFRNETGYFELDEDKIRWEDDQMKVIDTDPAGNTMTTITQP